MCTVNILEVHDTPFFIQAISSRTQFTVNILHVHDTPFFKLRSLHSYLVSNHIFHVLPLSSGGDLVADYSSTTTVNILLKRKKVSCFIGSGGVVKKCVLHACLLAAVYHFHMPFKHRGRKEMVGGGGGGGAVVKTLST